MPTFHPLPCLPAPSSSWLIMRHPSSHHACLYHTCLLSCITACCLNFWQHVAPRSVLFSHSCRNIVRSGLIVSRSFCRVPPAYPACPNHIHCHHLRSPPLKFLIYPSALPRWQGLGRLNKADDTPHIPHLLSTPPTWKDNSDCALQPASGRAVLRGSLAGSVVAPICGWLGWANTYRDAVQRPTWQTLGFMG